MPGQDRWLMIAGGLMLLVGSATQLRRAPEAAAAIPPKAPATPAPSVFVRDASGERRALPLSLFTDEVLVLRLPKAWAGERVEVTLWRRRDGRREPTAWLTTRPWLDGDGQLSMAGIVAGSYDVEVKGAFGALAAEAVRSPGEVALAHAAPVR